MKITRDDFNAAMRRGIAKGKEVNEKSVEEMIQELLDMIDKMKGEQNEK